MMLIKSRGGVFGRNPTFKNVEVEGNLEVDGTLSTGGSNVLVDTDIGSTVQAYDADTAKLDIAQTFTAAQTISNDSGLVITVKRTTDVGPLVDFYKDTTNLGSITTAYGGTEIAIGSGAYGVRFTPSRAGILPHNITTNLKDDGGIHLGNPDARFNNLYLAGSVVVDSGSGIDFSATAGTGTSELFDDYEEGLYTATATPHTSGSITLKSTHNEASYTKVGRLVTVNALLQVDSVSSPVGTSVNISLPFAVADLDEFAGRFGGAANVKSTATPFVGVEGGSLVYIEVDASTITGNDNFYLSFSYMAA